MTLPRPPNRLGKGHPLPNPHCLNAFGVSISATLAPRSSEALRIFFRIGPWRARTFATVAGPTNFLQFPLRRSVENPVWKIPDPDSVIEQVGNKIKCFVASETCHLSNEINTNFSWIIVRIRTLSAIPRWQTFH